MVLADDRILEYIHNNGSGAPKEMKDSNYVRFTRSYISQRCKKLVDEGFLRHLGNGIYVITDRGEKYLNGEINAETLEEIDQDQPDIDPGRSQAEDGN
jgi:predicted transcriptional regulator